MFRKFRKTVVYLAVVSTFTLGAFSLAGCRDLLFGAPPAESSDPPLVLPDGWWEPVIPLLS